MSSKRALVVDDSKSARAFLSRILERHEILVDAAESAEAAIEYLTRNRPDVIFMDHMMPGMDGFQAVQTIKNNPRTSAIPILMYTSQEGDLYLGQARALGAEGVLPKQIKQADVTKMLFQLRLVNDRRGGEQTTFTRLAAAPELASANESAMHSAIVLPTAVPTIEVAPGAEGAAPHFPIADLLPKLSLEIRAALDQSLQKEVAALRNFIGTTLDSQAEKLQTDIAALSLATPAPTLDMPTLIPERRPWAYVGWTFAFLAVCGAAAMSWLWWTQGAEIAALRTDLTAAYAEVETLRARPEVVSPPAAPAEVLPAEEAALDATAVEATPAEVPAVEVTVAPAATATPLPVAPAAASPAASPAAASAVKAAPAPAVTAAAVPAVAPTVAPASASPQTLQAQ